MGASASLGRASSTAEDDCVSCSSRTSLTTTLMTITIEGSLKGPPPFDADAFKAKLAAKLDKEPDHFRVRRAEGSTRHELTSGGVMVTVDVDEEGYLRHEAMTSRGGSGSDTSGVSSVDKAAEEGGITHAIVKALKPLRAPSEAIKILWTREG